MIIEKNPELYEGNTYIQACPIHKRHECGEHFIDSRRVNEPAGNVSEMAHAPGQLAEDMDSGTRWQQIRLETYVYSNCLLLKNKS
jgi:hypothetical protein